MLVAAVAVNAQVRVKVVSKAANVREQPNREAKVLQTAKMGASYVYVMETGIGKMTVRGSDFWVMVRLPDRDLAGWMHSSTISISKDADREAAPEFYQRLAMPEPTADKPRTYISGPRGGCYYVNRTGNRTYVDHERCR